MSDWKSSRCSEYSDGTSEPMKVSMSWRSLSRRLAAMMREAAWRVSRATPTDEAGGRGTPGRQWRRS